MQFGVAMKTHGKHHQKVQATIIQRNPWVTFWNWLKLPTSATPNLPPQQQAAQQLWMQQMSTQLFSGSAGGVTTKVDVPTVCITQQNNITVQAPAAPQTDPAQLAAERAATASALEGDILAKEQSIRGMQGDLDHLQKIAGLCDQLGPLQAQLDTWRRTMGYNYYDWMTVQKQADDLKDQINQLLPQAQRTDLLWKYRSNINLKMTADYQLNPQLYPGESAKNALVSEDPTSVRQLITYLGDQIFDQSNRLDLMQTRYAGLVGAP